MNKIGQHALVFCMAKCLTLANSNSRPHGYFSRRRDRIQPRPTSWLSVKMRSFENRDLCVITLRQVVSDDWFYLNDGGTSKFYVREGNSTRLLSGPDADEYKRANPR